MAIKEGRSKPVLIQVNVISSKLVGLGFALPLGCFYANFECDTGASPRLPGIRSGAGAARSPTRRIRGRVDQAVRSVRAGRSPAGLHVDGAQIRFVGLSLRDFLAIAYRIKANVNLRTGLDCDRTLRYFGDPSRRQHPSPASGNVSGAPRRQVPGESAQRQEGFSSLRAPRRQRGLKMKESAPDPKPIKTTAEGHEQCRDHGHR